MDSWIFQGGYPLISVEAGDDAADDHACRSERFLYDGDAGRRTRLATAAKRWAVPVNLRASVGGVVQRQRLLVDGPAASIDFDGPVDWVVVNDGAWGFYRVHYDPALLGRLTGAGLATVCDPLERMALVDRLLGRRGVGDHHPRRVGRRPVEALGDEDDPDVWAAISGALRLARSHRQPIRTTGPPCEHFVRRSPGRRWARLGWEPRPGRIAAHGHHPRAGAVRPWPCSAAIPASATPRRPAFERFSRPTGPGWQPTC